MKLVRLLFVAVSVLAVWPISVDADTGDNLAFILAHNPPDGGISGVVQSCAFTALTDIIKADGSKNVVVAGLCELLNCKNSIVVTEDRGHLIAGIGLENIIVAHSEDATLICDINQAQRLKELIETLEKNGKGSFL